MLQREQQQWEENDGLVEMVEENIVYRKARKGVKQSAQQGKVLV